MCSICSKPYTSHQSLKVHMRYTHRDGKTKKRKHSHDSSEVNGKKSPSVPTSTITSEVSISNQKKIYILSIR